MESVESKDDGQSWTITVDTEAGLPFPVKDLYKWKPREWETAELNPVMAMMDVDLLRAPTARVHGIWDGGHFRASDQQQRRSVLLSLSRGRTWLRIALSSDWVLYAMEHTPNGVYLFAYRLTTPSWTTPVWDDATPKLYWDNLGVFARFAPSFEPHMMVLDGRDRLLVSGAYGGDCVVMQYPTFASGLLRKPPKDQSKPFDWDERLSQTLPPAVMPVPVLYNVPRAKPKAQPPFATPVTDVPDDGVKRRQLVYRAVYAHEAVETTATRPVMQTLLFHTKRHVAGNPLTISVLNGRIIGALVDADDITRLISPEYLLPPTATRTPTVVRFMDIDAAAAPF